MFVICYTCIRKVILRGYLALLKVRRPGKNAQTVPLRSCVYLIQRKRAFFGVACPKLLVQERAQPVNVNQAGRVQTEQFRTNALIRRKLNLGVNGSTTIVISLLAKGCLGVF